MGVTNTYVFITEHCLQEHCGVTSYFMAEALSRMEGNLVLFVERASSLLSPFRQALARRKLRDLGKVSEMTASFYGYTPFLRLPMDRKSSLISRVNQKSLARQIKSALRRVGAAPGAVTVITFNYNSGVAVRELKDVCAKSVYYVLDDWKEFSLLMSSRDAIVRDEDLTFASVNQVVTISDNLTQMAKAKGHGAAVTIPNGVNMMGFTAPPAPRPEMNSFRRPVIGFVGKIEEWVDLDLVRHLALASPQLDFVLVGPSAVDTSVVKSLPNVHLLGSKPMAQIPDYLSGMSIGIIPFRNIALVKSVSPLKLYEYLAAGLPVVTSPMDGVVGLEHLDVFVEQEYEAFHQRILALIASFDGDEIRQEARRAFALENSWDRKAQKLTEVLSAV